MTQEDKELLLKDLCARLPYDVKVITKYNFTPDDCWNDVDKEDAFELDVDDIFNFMNNKIEIKPYLRPMSSMTEEEAMEYANCGNIIANSSQNNYLIPNPNCVDWLNAHHFDYRGLIEKKLALDCTGLHIYD